MPAKSKAQARASQMALAAKRGEISPKKLKGAAKDMYNSMTEKELQDYAETSHNDLPEKKGSYNKRQAFHDELLKEL